MTSEKNKTSDPAYLARVQEIIETRRETDSSPYWSGSSAGCTRSSSGREPTTGDLKKAYNDLVLSMEDALAREIEAADDPLAKAFVMARIGNYIDFGAMNHVDEGTFLRLFEDTEMRRRRIRRRSMRPSSRSARRQSVFFSSATTAGRSCSTGSLFGSSRSGSRVLRSPRWCGAARS